MLACTPIGSVRDPHEDAGTLAQREQSPAGSGGSAAVGGTTVASFEGSACDREAARLCAPGNPSRQPLECTGGKWQPQAQCSQDQRCEVSAGADLGHCIGIVHDCAGRTVDQQFCDGKEIRACSSAGEVKTVRACGAHQACSQNNTGAVSCTCQIGSVPMGDDCEQATTCDMGTGPCDKLSACSMVSGKPVCAACPESFVGAGETGCIPQLSGLNVMGGLALTPTFDPNMTSYRVHVPLTAARVSLLATGPVQASIAINGVPLDASGAWTSPVLPLGEHPVQVVVTSISAITNKYELIVERPGRQDAYVKANHPDEGDTFGISASLSGDTLVVGATSEDGAVGGVNGDETSNGVLDSGAVYVFGRDGERWVQQAYLKADTPTVSAFFGKDVAIDDDTLVVAEPCASPYLNTLTAPRRGSVYVFTRNAGVWARTQVIQPSDVQDADMYGFSLALDHDTLVIGAPWESSGGSNSGAIYVASRSDNFKNPIKLKAKTPVAGEYLGWSVSVSGDTMFVGAHQDADTTSSGPGHVYVFERHGGVWEELQRLGAPEPVDGSTFGWSVSVHDTWAAVGAPHATTSPVLKTASGETHVFQHIAGQWQYDWKLTPTNPQMNDYFGASVDVANGTVLVCANGDSSGARGLDGESSRTDGDSSGAFYLFGREDTKWVRALYGKASNADNGDRLGAKCLLSGDHVLVSSILEASGKPNDPADNSALNAGALYMFR